MRHTISTIVVLALIWLANSGHYTGLILGLGVVSIGFVVWIAHKMDVVDAESTPFHLSSRLPGFYLWLIRKIIASNIDVAKRVWGGAGAISPVVKTLPLTQKTDMGRVIYANSITLTPGTVSIDLNEDQVTVHALSEDGMQELEEGEMNRRVTALED